MAQENEQQNIGKNTTQPTAATQPKKSVVIVVCILGAILVLGIGGFFLFKDRLLSSKSAITGKVLNADCKLNDKDLCKFINNFREIKNVSMKSVTAAGDKKTESTMEIQGDDKSHIMSITDGKEDSNYISIGNITYTKDYTDNKWWKFTEEKTQTTQSTQTDWKNEFDDNDQKTTYKKIGQEPCGKLTCLKYQVVDSQNSDTTSYIWFDTKEYLLRKTRNESQGVVIETTVSYDKVNITEPSPIKEAKSQEEIYQNMVGGTGQIPVSPTEGMTQEQYEQFQLNDADGAEGNTTIPLE